MWLQVSRRRAYERVHSRNTVIPLHYRWVWSIAAISLFAAVIEVVIPNPNSQVVATKWWTRVKVVKVVLGEWLVEALVVFLVQMDAGGIALFRSVVAGGVSAAFMATSFILTNHASFGFTMPLVQCTSYGAVATTNSTMEKCVGELFSYAYTGLLVVGFVIAACACVSTCVLRCPCVCQTILIFVSHVSQLPENRYLVIFILRRNTRRIGLLILLSTLMIARTIDVLVMIHPCFDVCSLVWWSFAYPLGIVMVVRADSNFFREDFLVRHPRQKRVRRQWGTMSDTDGQTDDDDDYFPRFTRPRGDTVVDTAPSGLLIRFVVYGAIVLWKRRRGEFFMLRA